MGWWSSLGSSGQAAAVAGGSGIIGGLMSGISQPIINKKNQRFAVAQNNKAWQREVDMWNWTNRYNSPVEQRKRLEQAGLNPALMYGKAGTYGNATAGNSPQGDTPNAIAPDFSGITNAGPMALDAINNFRRTDAQTGAVESQIRLNETIAGLNMAKTAEQLRDTKYKKGLEKLSAEVVEQTVKKMKEDIKFTMTQREINIAKNIRDADESMKRILKMDEEIQQLIRTGQLTMGQLENIVAGTNLKRQELSLLKQGIGKNAPPYWLWFNQNKEDIKNKIKKPEWFNKGLFFGGKQKLGTFFPTK